MTGRNTKVEEQMRSLLSILAGTLAVDLPSLNVLHEPFVSLEHVNLNSGNSGWQCRNQISILRWTSFLFSDLVCVVRSRSCDHSKARRKNFFFIF